MDSPWGTNKNGGLDSFPVSLPACQRLWHRGHHTSTSGVDRFVTSLFEIVLPWCPVLTETHAHDIGRLQRVARTDQTAYISLVANWGSASITAEPAQISCSPVPRYGYNYARVYYLKCFLKIIGLCLCLVYIYGFELVH